MFTVLNLSEKRLEALLKNNLMTTTENSASKDKAATPNNTPSNDISSWTNGEHLDIENLILAIQQSLNDFAPVSTASAMKILIVIEDLTALFHELNETANIEKNIVSILRRLRRSKSCMQKSGDEFPDVCITTRIHSSKGDLHLSRFANSVAFSLANISIDVHALKTGASSEVTGKLTIYRKLKNVCDSAKVSSSQFQGAKGFHYKVEDRSVKVTPL